MVRVIRNVQHESLKRVEYPTVVSRVYRSSVVLYILKSFMYLIGLLYGVHRPEYAHSNLDWCSITNNNTLDDMLVDMNALVNRNDHLKERLAGGSHVNWMPQCAGGGIHVTAQVIRTRVHPFTMAAVWSTREVT